MGWWVGGAPQIRGDVRGKREREDGDCRKGRISSMKEPLKLAIKDANCCRPMGPEIDG
jgi:hypothetical protein